ncbi:MAG: DUF2341 domain-containing protein [Thermodesulfobacteriota bacterium]
MKKLNLTNFLFGGYHPKSMKIENPPSSPFVKGGITTPPFSKGRLGGIFFLTNIKGISVIFLVIAMLLMVTIGYVFSYLIPTKQKSVVFPIQSTQAFFIAQSGVEFAVRYAKDQSWTTKAQLAGLTGMTRTFGAGSFTLTYTNTAPNLDTLTSVGYVPAGTERRRIVVSNLTSFLNYFAYHKTITVQAGQVSAGPLTNFPMLVSVTDPNLATVASGGHVASYNAGTNDPWDIIFEGLDDTTCGGAGTSPCKLNHEIEAYAPATGTLVAWVRVPSINNGTVIYMYYGNGCMTASTQSATGVWDATYKGVWHLSQSPTGTAPQMKDSTSNGYNGTANGGFVAGDQQTAKIDGGLDFESAHNDYVQIAAAALGTTSVTVSAWIKVTSFTEYTFGGTTNPSLGAVVFSTRDLDANVSPTLLVSAASNGGGFGGPTSLVFCDDTANVAVGAKGATTIATGTWYYAVGTFSYNAGTATYLGNWNVYRNGVQDNAAANNFDYAGTATVPFSGASWILGNDPQWTTANTDSNVILDEVRVSNIARSAGWILTEYNNQSTPGNLGAPGFYGVGAEQNN